MTQQKNLRKILIFFFASFLLFLLSFSIYYVASADPKPNSVHPITEDPFLTSSDELTEGKRMPENKPNAKTAVYFVPHADDETLSMAPDIINHLRLGYDVHLVLISHGEHSSAQFVLNNFKGPMPDQKDPSGKKYFCPWHKRYHNPTKEQYLDSDDGMIDLHEVGDSRVREFLAAGEALGVPKENLHVYDVTNGFFTEDKIRPIYDEFIERYPDALFRTMSQWDWHPDHAFLGKLLTLYEKEGKVKTNQTAYFLSAYKFRFTKYQLPVKEYTGYFLHASDAKKMKKAIGVYKRWDPKNGWYGLGYHSVPSQFDAVEKNMVFKYHVNNY